jgi:cysteinyl-tRNA synthetase
VNRVADSETVSAQGAKAAFELLNRMDSVLGVLKEKAALLPKEIEALIEERIQARKEKNFARADEIRDQLDAQGIVLKDTPEGTKWQWK